MQNSTFKKNRSQVLVWDKKVQGTQLEIFQRTIEKKYNKHFESYWELHKWSIENFENFWGEVWNYMDVIHSNGYEEVYRKTGDGFLDCEWFPGARFNFAENILRIKDNRVALLYADENGYEESVTYSEMFEEVKLYAAAMRKNGLKKDDRVACYISNRKEPFFIFLAATSIGAIFGGPQPYLGCKHTSNIIKKMEPRFLFAIDQHKIAGVDHSSIDNLPFIVDNTPTLEKVIIIPTKPETLSRDTSNIRNSCFLEEFLDCGRTPDGTIPDIEFEQLPFDHPISINFTSGTTGLPKAPLHSAGTLLTHFGHDILYCNLESGDVIHTCYPVGWTFWDLFVPFLTQGVTLFLHAGNPVYESQGSNIWDIFSQYKITHTYLCTSMLDILETQNIIPRPKLNLENLKFVIAAGSPVTERNYLFVRKMVKHAFVCSLYGASESFGSFTGFDINLPCYAAEIQVPALGMNMLCFDDKGNAVENQRGEMVLATPTPALPIYLWKDEGNLILKETYLSQYPGVWQQNDEIWINPNTKGFVVFGRSDDTMLQHGERLNSMDIYSANCSIFRTWNRIIQCLEEIEDCICVGQRKADGGSRAVLFIKMKNGHQFNSDFREKVEMKICDEYWYYSVPELILEIKDIPYNINNKKMESVIRQILAVNQIPEVSNIKNPECLKFFIDIPEIVSYK